MKVFLAGATGVLGVSAIPKLVRAGHEVSGLARTPGKATMLTVLGARPVTIEGGMRASEIATGEFAAALAGHDVLVNLASSIPTGLRAARRGAWRENDRIRTDGSRLLVAAARLAGIARFVQEAVGFVYADGGDDLLTEHSPLDPTTIARSSLTATDNARAYADDRHFAVVLRFGMLYGDDPATRWLLDRASRGRPCVFGAPDGFVAPLHVEDAADAVVASLGAPSGVYNVAAAPATHEEYAAALGAAAGRDEAARFVPSWQQRAMGWRAATMGRSLRMSSDAYARATGWHAKTAFKDGWPS